MKKTFGKVREHARSCVKNLSSTTHRNMSRGSEYINRFISWARKDNWRRIQKVKKSSKSSGK